MATARWGRVCGLLLAAGLGLGGVTARAMPAAPAGVSETGAPSFVVLGPEALGLSSTPNDLHLLPDGRTLVVSQRELAFGDGVRWETFRAAEDQPAILTTVVIDHLGQIYTSMEGGFARMELGEDARWHGIPVMKMPGAAVQNAPLVSVVEFSGLWYWYGSNGVVVSWRPGQKPRLAADVSAIDRIFSLGPDVYFSDESTGRLFRWKEDGAVEQVPSVDVVVSESVTCAIPFGPGQLLVGTVSAGLKLFDGKTFRPFGPPGLLNNGQRITDLCLTGEGYFAAAIDTFGIVFFEHEGRTVQVLERSLDHRLARVRRLQYASDGVLWALLNEGVARVKFPSPVSHFEPLLASGLVYAHPLRHAGQLWILTDGRVMHGVYDDSGRLERFRDETPPGRYVFTVDEVDGRLFASNDQGIYVYEKAGWRLVLPGIVNARLGLAPSTKDGLFYAGLGEYGMIQPIGDRYVARRIPVPELGENYNPVVDSAGIGWFELGMNRVGRLDPNGGTPLLQILGTKDGLTEGWIEVYLLDGIARFHVGNHLYRFDDDRRKFVEDRELLARIPQLAVAGGRPVTDGSGRLWYTANGTNQLIDRSATGGNRPVKITPVGFAPVNFTLEEDGVVWMFEKRRLARMDPRLPQPPESPLRALITSVQFSASSRQLFAPGTALKSLNYADNSLVIHFVAPANPFASPVTFEAQLEGAGTSWVSTGAVGSAAFNRLKEGDYVFHVRPVAGGTTRGTEARLEFTVLPPWYRTPVAWAIYSIATVGLFAFAIWLSSFLQRRENERLELLVARRTEELNTTNAQLGRQIGETTEKSTALSVSEERYRLLNAGLEDRVQKRTAELTEASGLLDAMLENTPDLIYFKDRESRFTRFSRAFGLRFNLADPKLVRGKTDFDLFAAEHAQAAYDDEQKIIRSGEAIIGKLEKETYPDGRVTWVLTTKMPWHDGAGTIIGSFGISKDVTAWKEAEAKLADTHKQLLDASRMAGMAEVATGVLHNVGNVLNSLNVSSTVIATGVRQSKTDSLARLSTLLNEHTTDLAEFLTRDPKGRRLPELIASLARHFGEERNRLLAETKSLQNNIDHIKEIISRQQAYATVVAIVEPLAAATLMEEALQITSTSLSRHKVRLVRQFQSVPPVLVEKGKVLQILINLIRNAQYACDDSHKAAKVLNVGVEPGAPGFVRLVVRDNGIGIPAENLTRIFSQGFTTRSYGHGFGLHSSALAAKELKGTLTAHSDGPGLGATFVLTLPVAVARPTSPAAAVAREAAVPVG